MLANDVSVTIPFREACAENRLVNDGEEPTMTTIVTTIASTNHMENEHRSWFGKGLRNEMLKAVERHAKPYRRIPWSSLRPTQG